MAREVSTKSLVDQCLQANFQHTFNNITANNLNLKNSSAVKIIVAVCNACYSNLSTPNNINEQDLADLVKCLLKFIHQPSNEQFESYLQSAFHILKLLQEKKNFECIVQLRELFIPEFMPVSLTKEHHTIYESICKSIYNVIVRTIPTVDETQKSGLLRLTILQTSIHKRLGRKNSFLENVHNCLLALLMLNISLEELIQYYDYVIKSLNSLEASLYPAVINNLSLLYTHLLKNEKYKLASRCYNSTCERLRSLKGKEFGFLNDIMEIVEWVNPGNGTSVTTQTPERVHTSLKTYHKNYGSTAALQSVCTLVSSVGYAVLQLYKKNNLSIENAHFYNFLNDVAVILAKNPYTCHCKKCSTATNINEALRILNTIGGLGRLCITNKNDLSRSYKIDIFRYLEKQVDYVTTLKSNKCEKWEKHWYDVGVHLYSIGTHLYQKNETEMLMLYLQKFVRTLLKLEGFEPKIIDRTYLVSAFSCIANAHFESQDFEKSLLLSSLAIICSDSPKKEINRWIKTKVVSREKSIEGNSELQLLTLVSVCGKYQTELETYIPKSGLGLTTKRKIELLHYELKQYNAKWKSKIPMSTVFGELSQIASAQFTAEVFVEIWGDGDLMVHETIPRLLQGTIKRVEGGKISTKDLLLAHLYFLQHKYQVKDVIVKNCDEMEKTMNLTKTAEATAVPPDPDEECDLVSSYHSLKLSRYTKMMEELNKSLELSQKWIEKNNDDYDRERFYKLLSNIGHEYCLHGHTTKSLLAWQLALKVAQSVDSPLYKLEATGFIIELGDIRKPLLQNLTVEVEKGVSTLTTNNYEALIVYYLSKAEAYLYVDFKKAYLSFKKAMQYHQNHQSTNIMQARIHLLHHKFLSLPCEYNVPDHKEYYLVKIHQANNCATTYYNESSTMSSYEMRIFFEVYENIVKMYHDLRQPREVRCYAKDAVVIAQKMVLPLRTAALLYYLAHADIATGRLNDCRVKLTDFRDILSLNKSKSVANLPVPPPQKKEEVDILVEDFTEMVLDVPKNVGYTSSGSPCFKVESFKLPFFLSHDEDCECFYCTCFEYQEFVLKQTLLNALLHQHEESFYVCKDFFSGCIKIYDYITHRESVYVKKTAKKISADLVPALREKFAGIYFFMLVEYAYFLIRQKKLKEGANLSKKLVAEIEPFKLQFIHLYNEVLLQRLNILSRKMNVEEKCPRVVTPERKGEPDTKTPPQGTEVALPPTRPLPKTYSAKKVRPKALKFNSADYADETVYLKLPLPKSIPSEAKTPGPSNIGIYTNKSPKKSKSEIPVFKEPGVKEPSTSSDARDNNLAIRTKLLTDRLRSSSTSRKAGSGRQKSDCEDERKGAKKRNK